MCNSTPQGRRKDREEGKEEKWRGEDGKMEAWEWREGVVQC